MSLKQHPLDRCINCDAECGMLTWGFHLSVQHAVCGRVALPFGVPPLHRDHSAARPPHHGVGSPRQVEHNLTTFQFR
jgi:hypothetical protein